MLDFRPTDDSSDALQPPSQISVRLPANAQEFRLPPPPTGDLLLCFLLSYLELIGLAADTLIFPLLAFIYRIVLGPVDFSLFLVGPSGVFKSELAALMQQHFGPGLNARNLPGSWTSTANFLEVLTFLLKDVLCVIDDFAPTGSQADVARFHSQADRLLRGQGNSSGRGRLTADGRPRPPKSPRGGILSTGEDLPRGHSVKARAIILEVGPGDIDSVLLTKCQRLAREGDYAQCMAGFIAWLAPQYQAIRDGLREEIEQLREQNAGLHRRTSDSTASLAVGFRYFLRFAQETEAINEDQAAELWQRCQIALREVARRQSAQQASSEPATRYIELLVSAIASKKAHLANPQGEMPPQAEAYGWRKDGSGGEERWVPGGPRIGWVDGSDLYLDPEAAYNVAKRFGDEGGDSLVIGPKTLSKRLHERRLLKSIEESRGTLTVRRALEGVARRSVLHLSIRSLRGDTPSDPDTPADLDGADSTALDGHFDQGEGTL